MKNSFYLFYSIILTLPILLEAQTVTGRLVDENGTGLSSINLQLYINPDVYNTTSLSDGSFFFDIITDIEDEQLPTGYAVSNNFPNPFNPATRIGITLPVGANVKVAVYNILGQQVLGVIEKYFNAGTNYIDIELQGLPSGFYLAKISIDDKYTVINKMMLIYGSQHLSINGSIQNSILPKSNGNISTDIDSLVATSLIIGRKSFTNLPGLVGDTLDLGNLIIERYCPGTPTVLYEGKTYHTVKIGSQCWLKENLDVGTMVNGNQNQTNNGIKEKYCYGNDTNNCNTYGGLYQWDEAMQYSTNPGAQGICPPGWHIPTLAELQTLAATVNNNGNALKREDQGSGNGQGTNISGFSALLAGSRIPVWGGIFKELGYYTSFWSSTEFNDAVTAYGLWLIYNGSDIYLTPTGKEIGVSVRCIKD